MYNELLMYFEQHEILAKQQCGFRKELSINIAIGNFLNRVYAGVNEGKFGVGIFLDLQKAFDMVNHKILKEKLRHYGVRGMPLQLIESFLSDRKQYVKIDKNKSSILTSSIGTPQGSVISPLLFLIFINDIVNSSDILNFSLFADDTCIYASDSNLENLYVRVNHEILQVEKWIKANLLSLNINKTVYLLFSGNIIFSRTPPLMIFNSMISRKNVTKFLGILIDEKLTWKPHVKCLLGKISRVAGIMSKIKNTMTTQSLKMIYYGLIYPFIHYGIVFWATVAKREFDKIFRIQKKVVRFIAGVGRFEHSEPIFKKINILKLCDVKNLETAKFIFSDIGHNRFFSFENRSHIHSYSTRNNLNFVLPHPRTDLMRNSVFYTGLKDFERISMEIKNSTSKNSFKTKLKTSLLSFYSLT